MNHGVFPVTIWFLFGQVARVSNMNPFKVILGLGPTYSHSTAIIEWAKTLFLKE